MKPTNTVLIYGYESYTVDNTIFISEKDFQSPVFQTAQYSPDILSKIHHSKLEGNFFLELFNFKDVSLYWFMYPAFWSQLTTSTNFIDRFFEYVEKKNPSSLYLKNDFSKYYLLKQICKKKNISFSYSKIQFLKFKLRRKITPLRRKIHLKKIHLKKIQSKIALYNKKSSKTPSLENKIIFASSDVYRRPLINHKKLITEEGEFFIDDLLDILPPLSTLGIALDYDVYGNFSKLERRLNSELDWIPVESFLKKTQKNIEQNNFLENYKKILKNKNFQLLFSYKEISLWPQLESTFFQMTFEPYFPFWMNLIDSLTLLFQKSKPKMIFLPYETGPLALCFIIAGKKTSIPTIGMQHGVIAENWKYYSFNPLEIDSPFGFPLPTKYLLFGDYSKRILLKNGYPSQKLISFGNPLFFNLDKKQKVLEKMNIKNKHNIPDNKTIIFFPTISLQKFQSWSQSNHNTEIWDYLLATYTNDENYFLIIKPHPDEDSKIYEDMAKKYDSSNILISKDSLYEFVYVSDVIVSMFSTAIIDSLCFGKPVIQVEFIDDEDSPIPYTKLGVTLSANLENLSEKISKVLTDDPEFLNLSKNQQTFIKDMYNIPEDKPDLVLKDLFKTFS